MTDDDSEKEGIEHRRRRWGCRCFPVSVEFVEFRSIPTNDELACDGRRKERGRSLPQRQSWTRKFSALELATENRDLSSVSNDGQQLLSRLLWLKSIGPRIATKLDKDCNKARESIPRSSRVWPWFEFVGLCFLTGFSLHRHVSNLITPRTQPMLDLGFIRSPPPRDIYGLTGSSCWSKRESLIEAAPSTAAEREVQLCSWFMKPQQSQSQFDLGKLVVSCHRLSRKDLFWTSEKRGWAWSEELGSVGIKKIQVLDLSSNSFSGVIGVGFGGLRDLKTTC